MKIISTIFVGAIVGAIVVGSIVLMRSNTNTESLGEALRTFNSAQLSTTTATAGYYLKTDGVHNLWEPVSAISSAVYIGTSSPWTVGNLAYVVDDSTVSSVATGTLTTDATGLEFNSTRALVGGSSVLSLSTGYAIPQTSDISNWNTAYGWGNHAGLYDPLGQATSTLTSHTSTYNHANYDTAFGWGNHAVQGYITDGNTNWDNSYGFVTEGQTVGTTSAGIAGQAAYWTGIRTLAPVATGTLTENALGLEFDNSTRGLFGGAATLSLTSGYVIPTTTRAVNWDTAYTQSHSAVTLAGEDYLTLSTQQITANAIDPDNLSASDFGSFTCNGTTCTLDNDSITPNMVLSTGQTDEFCLTYESTGPTWEWQTCGSGGGGSGGGWATTTDSNPEAGELVTYTTYDAYIGGSSSTSAAFNFDPESSKLTIASTTAVATGTIFSQSGGIKFGSSTGESVEFNFNTSNTLKLFSSTGVNQFDFGSLVASTSYASTTGLTVANLWGNYATTTLLSTVTLCLSGDCRTAFPTGGGGSGMATTTDTNDEVGETVSYVTTDVYIGGSSSTTAEFNFDKDSSKLTIASTTANATGTIYSQSGAIKFGSSTADSIEFNFNTSDVLKLFSSTGLNVFDFGDLRASSSYASTTGISGANSNFITASSSSLYVGGTFGFLGDVITNVLTWLDSKIELLSNVVAAAASVWDFGGAASLEIPNAAGPTVDATGEIALDTTDNQLLVADSGGTVRVFGHDEFRIISLTIGSTSPSFVSGYTLPVLSVKDGLEITQYRCYVKSGTSKVVNLTDGTNDTETITCGTTVTSDTDVATNDTFTADELGYLEMGATTGAVDYLHFEAYARIVRE